MKNHRQNNNLAGVAGVLTSANSVILSGHVMPDGDSIGSTIALGLALEKMGKKVTLSSPHAVPEMYRFLPGAHRVHQGLPEGEYDVFVVLDCSVPDRLGDRLQKLLDKDITVVNIDHHQTKETFAHVNYIDPKAAATGEIIYDLLVEMGVDLDLDIATNLYTAIVTDTGAFKYEGTTANTHRKAAALLECGVPGSRICKLLYDEKPIEVLKVLQAALPTLSISPCGKVAWISFDWQSRQRVGARDEHTDELVDYPRKIKGVEVAMLFREISPGSVKVSMRSNYYVDVNKLAAQFDGGGHKRAAGCLIQGEFNAVKERVIEAAIQVVQRGT
ncbi:phosphoesterase RecJ-like protein [Desulfohalotomaculum tongense]|uniref:DHH family phosphoesterase n=1 Tax=Desulforadius tongensis TaxID=1216062 RepID=UPI00195725D4|nr:bifunctional oligoribonuclease/PAP phosphatase NrnA [Desulforadius tongensis]MBM7854441.1 phosphoesterase RecJ-like protein [Desulforadius tongensis]